MREIKFRQPIYDKKGNFIRFHYWGWMSEGAFITPLSMGHNVKKEKGLKFTGLRDKNGKEIFEGDILSGGVWYGWENETGLGVVKFSSYKQDGSDGEYGSSTCCGWYIEILKTQFSNLSVNTQSLFNGEDLKKNKRKRIEVIGNIYENPELLEQSND